jgi:hypothetical protein
VKILAIDDGVPPKTATATLTVIVQDINDNAPKLLRDYRPVLPEHVPARKVVEVLATDDDDRSKSNGPPFTFRMDPNADDVIRASFKVEHDQSTYNQRYFFSICYRPVVTIKHYDCSKPNFRVEGNIKNDNTVAYFYFIFT